MGGWVSVFHVDFPFAGIGYFQIICRHILGCEYGVESEFALYPRIVLYTVCVSKQERGEIFVEITDKNVFWLLCNRLAQKSGSVFVICVIK